MADGTPIPLRLAPSPAPAAQPEAVAGLVLGIKLLAALCGAQTAVIAGLLFWPVG